MKVLVIEDDSKISSYLCKGLRQEGHAVDAVSLGDDGVLMQETHRYDMVLLDLMLPDESGFEVLQQIKKRPDAPPVIIVSAKGSVDDRVRGLELGADDYMTKPVSFVELSGRMRAIMRRRHVGEACDPQAEVFRQGVLTFDRVRRQVMCGSCAAGLTERESLLLEFLMQNHERLVTKRLIFEHVWSYDSSPQTNVVDVLVCRLRAKLLTVLNCDAIQTVRGLGYMFKLS